MTKTEAAQFLEVEVDASLGDVQRRYRELHYEFHVRLTNAPTPALRKTYQKHLQETQEACEVLWPGVTGDVASDLPIAERMHVEGPRHDSEVSSLPSAPPRPVREAGLPRSTMVAATVAVVFAGLASLLAIVSLKAGRSLAALESVVSRQSTAMKAVETQAKETQRLLQTGHLDVCNRSAKEIKVEAVAVIYRDSEGKVKSIHSGAFGYPTWDIRPAARARIDVLRGRPDDWDGSAAFYALQLMYEDAEPFILAGLLSEARDGCVSLYLD